MTKEGRENMLPRPSPKPNRLWRRRHKRQTIKPRIIYHRKARAPPHLYSRPYASFVIGKLSQSRRHVAKSEHSTDIGGQQPQNAI